MAAPGNRIGKKEKNEDFYKAILLLKDEEECYSFFRDVCTIAELRAMEQRFEVARMLTQGKVYSEILERSSASSVSPASSRWRNSAVLALSASSSSWR